MMNVNLTERNSALLFLGSKETSLSSMLGAYGNAFTYLMAAKPGNTIYQDYLLERTEWAKKSTDDFRCTNDKNTVSIESCIDNYFEELLGCSSVYQQSPRTKPLCTMKSQYDHWMTTYSNFMQLGETAIYNATRCLAPCRYFEYRIREVGELLSTDEPDLADGEKRLYLRFTFLSGKYEVKEEYYVYNEDSLIADVGGYLGLLLGHSVYSIVCGMHAFGSYLKSLKENLIAKD